jgi:hypothetical protein
VFLIVDFSSVNDLKLTYVHLQFQFFSGVIPRTPVIKERGWKVRGWKGGEGMGREGKGRDEAPKTNPVYGPAYFTSIITTAITLKSPILAKRSILEN